MLERAAIEGRIFHRGSVAALVPDAQARWPRHHLMALVRRSLFARPGSICRRRRLSLTPPHPHFAMPHTTESQSASVRSYTSGSLPGWKRRPAIGVPRQTDGRVPPRTVIPVSRARLRTTRRTATRPGSPGGRASGRRRRRHRATPHDPAGTQNLLDRRDGSPSGGPSRGPGLLLALAAAARDVGDLGHAGDVYERALSEARAAGDERFELRIALNLESVHAETDPAYRFEVLRETADGRSPCSNATRTTPASSRPTVLSGGTTAPMAALRCFRRGSQTHAEACAQAW